MKWFILLLLFATDVQASPVWQQSQSHSIQLGIRDKFGDLKSYEALFVVEGQGKSFKLKKLVSGSRWGFVRFPEDFKSPGIPGKYRWKCYVGKQISAEGSFTF